MIQFVFMKVSVIICSYSMGRYDSFAETINSVLAQTYDSLELVIVVDGNKVVYDRVTEEFSDQENITFHLNEENKGISASRTIGAEIASGEVVAMIDDDATAESDWIENLLETYTTTDALAVGGIVMPNWVEEKPAFFPEEFYWLVGCNERGFGEHGEEVRNTYGSNISFKREPFLSVGGYDTRTGRKGSKHIQAHEAPVGIRLRNKFDKGVVYNTNAVVHHKLFEYRADPWWLTQRSFWQGYSKRIMDLILPEAKADKNDYLQQLLLVFVPMRVKKCIKSRSLVQLQQLVMIFIFTVATSTGYLYGMLKMYTENELPKIQSVDGESN